MRGKLCILCCFLLLSTYCWSQTAGASLQGTAIDPSGAVVPKAQVEARNVGTAAVWSVTTDGAGRYLIPMLPPGEFELRVSAAGFNTVTLKGIALAVGQAAIINVNLELGAVTTEVIVTRYDTAMNLTSATLSGLVDDKQIRDLPLNGRSFTQLALLQPGVSLAAAAGNDVVGGRGPKITVNGARTEQNSFFLDGTDINNVYSKAPGSVAGVQLGVDAVMEFVVLANNYSAEFGRSPGGQINAVTRSGSNDMHGSAFEFLRNSAMDAKNFFDPKTKPIPAFKRNQFGATLGGPIVRDRTFFFGAYESLIERLGVTGVANVLDADARAGILAGRQISMHPAIPAFIDIFFPRANGVNLGGGLAEYLFSRSQPTDEHFFQMRIDHRISQADSLLARYTFDNGSVDRQPINKVPIAFTRERSRNQFLTLEQIHIFSSSLINSVRLGFNRSVQEADNVRTIDIPDSLAWAPPDKFGYFTISGVVTEMAGDYRLPRLDRLNNFQWEDTVFVTRGRHGIRFGTMGQRIQFNQDAVSQRGGIVTFTTLQNFLQAIPQSMDIALPGRIDTVRGYRQFLIGHFIQDDIRLLPNLTLNFGLRHEFITVPTEVNGKISNLRNVMDKALTIGDPWHSNPSKKNFAPRIGLAWDPFRDGKTSIRLGFGVFHDEILPKYYFFSGSLNPPFTTRTQLVFNGSPASFPNLVAGLNFDALKPQLQTVNFNLQNPYMLHYNFSIQRSLPWNWDVTVSYAGSRGSHLFRIADANLAPEIIVNGVKTYQPALGRRNPNFSSITQRITDAQSFYNAMQISAVKRSSHGLRAQVSYTFSRSVDDSSGINSQDFGNGVQYGLDFYDRKIDRGLSSFNTTHVLTFNWTYDLPFFKSYEGVGGLLLKGWQLNSITAVQSGTPFTVRLGFNRSGNLNVTSFSANDRPSLKQGYSNNPILGGPDRYWDISAFELPAENTRGSLGRNTLIGPGLFNLDLSLVKSFPLGEKRNLAFRAESFNLLNHPNFAVPSGQTSFTSAAGAISSTWGRITSTVTTSRQIQLGLKLAF